MIRIRRPGLDGLKGASGQSVIPADRIVNWKPGVTYNGGIPNRTTIFTTLSALGSGQDDTAQINTAIANAAAVPATAGNPQVVKLNSGLYNINGNGVFLNNSFVTLRGSGLPNAMATGGSLAEIQGGSPTDTLNYVSGTWLVKKDRATNLGAPVITIGRPVDTVQTPLLSTLLTADAVKDSFSCTVTSTSGLGLAVGKLVLIDHNTNSDPNVFWNTHDGPGADFIATISGTTMTVSSVVRGTISTATPLITGNGISYTSGNVTITGQTSGPAGGAGTYTINNAQTISSPTFLTAGFPTRRFFCRQDRSISQMMEITNINGNVITFSTPFYYTFKTAFSAQLTTFDETNFKVIEGSSIEDLGVFGGMGGDSAGNIPIGLSKRCWVKHVEAYWSTGTNIGIYGGFQDEVRDSFMHETPQPNPGGAGYQSGFNTWTSDSLYENCIMWVGNKETVSRGSGGGNVKAYCYMDDAFGGSYPESPEAGVNAGHFTTPYMELLEGCYSQSFKGDDFWGNSIYITVFRNWLSGIRGCSPTGSAPNIAPCNFYRNYTFNDGSGHIYPYGDYNGRTVVDNQAYSYFGNFVGNILGFSGQSFLSYSGTGYSSTQTQFVYEQLDALPNAVTDVTMWSIGALALTTSGFSWVTGSYVGQLRQGNYDFVSGLQKWHGIGGSDEYGSNPSAPFPAIPNSLYLPNGGGTIPSFVSGSSYGTTTWPLYNPATGDTGGFVSPRLPAMARFFAGTPNLL